MAAPRGKGLPELPGRLGRLGRPERPGRRDGQNARDARRARGPADAGHPGRSGGRPKRPVGTASPARPGVCRIFVAGRMERATVPQRGAMLRRSRVHHSALVSSGCTQARCTQDRRWTKKSDDSRNMKSQASSVSIQAMHIAIPLALPGFNVGVPASALPNGQ